MSPSPGRHAVTLLASGEFRAVYSAYVKLLQSLVLLAVALSLVVSIDRVLKVARHALILLHCAWTRRRPEQRFSARPLPDAAVYAALYPSVAVQLPMFNEAAVCQAIIDSVCELAWPRARFCVQVRLLEVRGWCDACSARTVQVTLDGPICAATQTHAVAAAPALLHTSSSARRERRPSLWSRLQCVRGALTPGATQVLDDSTCKATRTLVEDKVAEWRERGVTIRCVCRDNRQGYKAGALKEVLPTSTLLFPAACVALQTPMRTL